MAAKHEQSYVFNANINTICSVLRDADFTSDLRIELKSENPTENGVWFRFHHGVTFTSWGEKITITLSASDPSSTTVKILSECGMPTQIIDWGKNKTNVRNIHDALLKLLNSPNVKFAEPAPAAPATTPTPATAPNPTPAPAAAAAPDAPAMNFCTQCGTKIAPGSLFCSGCGRKLQ